MHDDDFLEPLREQARRRAALEPNGVRVHPSATLDDGATIGDGTKIWHYAHVCSGAVIGRGAVLGQNVYVGPNVRIGDRVRIQNNVSVYEAVDVEDDVFLGPSCVLTNVINPRSDVSRRDEFLRTRIRRGATVGANATIVCGVELGAWSFIGAGAVVTRDVPPFAQVVGSPARQTGWRCRCGCRLPVALTGVSEPTACEACGRVYRLGPDGLQPVDSIVDAGHESRAEGAG